MEVFVLRKKILEEYRSVQNQIDEIEKKLKQLPEGKLLFSRSNNNVKWYVSDGHKKVYLSKKKRHIAEQLAMKKYLQIRKEDFFRRKQMLENYFQYYIEDSYVTEEQLFQDENYRELLEPYLAPQDEESTAWMNESYEKNEKYADGLVHKTSSGIYVRSKSESMIELFLHTNQIPFRYECALHLGDLTLYPDFTIKHPKTKKIYYWEHFGIMDDPEYIRSTCWKLEQYANHGIIPSIQLITTYETKEYPLSYHEIARLGAEYFL